MVEFKLRSAQEMWDQAEKAAAAKRRNEITVIMARKTKKKVPRGGQEVSSFLQGHTTWEADTIQSIIAAGRFVILTLCC